MSSIGVIIPTWNNNQYLVPCLNSLLSPLSTEDLIHVYVVNNGDPGNMAAINHPRVTILQQEKNVGWEGGLKAGMAASKEDFLVFMNDDTYIPLFSTHWTNKLIDRFANPKVGAVGPSSNVVMGYQNIFTGTPGGYDIFKVKYLIGFCMMVRRKAVEDAGGIDDTLPGGDDFDLSIRLRKSGYDLLVDRNVFVYHHGFKTGERVNGGQSVNGGWNSVQMIERTWHALWRKHSVSEWLDTMNQLVVEENPYDPLKGWAEDSEGEVVRQHIVGDKVLELGCGARKTVPHAIGVDMIAYGEPIPGVAPHLRSLADVVGDAQNEIPVEPGSFDTVIARHVLEHVVDSVKAIRSWGNTLKPGGRLIIGVPNHQLRNTIPMNVQHVRAWTPDSLKNQMESLGWKTESIIDPKNYVSIVGVFTKNGLH